MSNSVEIEGLNELIADIEKMQISDNAIKKALKEIGEVVIEKTTQEAPNVTGYTRENIKKSISRGTEGLGVVITSRANYSTDTDWGTSKNKKYVGWFENGVEECGQEVLDICSDLVNTKGFR